MFSSFMLVFFKEYEINIRLKKKMYFYISLYFSRLKNYLMIADVFIVHQNLDIRSPNIYFFTILNIFLSQC